MISLRSAMIVVVFAMVVSLSGLAFAEMGHGGYKGGKIDKDAVAAHITVLRDSAKALQVSNPALAKGLNDLADKKTEMMKKWKEWQNKREADIKLLKDSAAVLQPSNMVLAQELEKMSQMKQAGRGMAGRGMMHKDEAEEAMESAE